MVRVSWSGGKDSTCAAILYGQENIEFYNLCYIPYLTEEIPLILKRQYDYLMETQDYFSRTFNTETYFVKGMTYYEYCNMYAFPPQNTKFCRFRDMSKIEALVSFPKTYDYIDIGIAIDEEHRHKTLCGIKKSILVDKGYTEYDAKMHVRKYWKESPMYLLGNRDGCIICPNNNGKYIQLYLQDYPKAKDILLELQTKQNKKGKYPLRNYKNFI